MKKNKGYIISIIGLGYVGLPLAIEFAKKYYTIGFDISKSRINELNNSYDRTLEVSTEKLKNILFKKDQNIDLNNKGLFLTTDQSKLKLSNVIIVTVPTPVDNNKKPNLNPLIKASKMVAKALNYGDIVIYESTVYPGVTEEECVPVLENISGLKFNKDFFVGYSPERINPGDKNRTVTKILKITSGSTIPIAKEIDKIYKSIITAGTYLAPSIKVAEAAKVIENSQRDINIAFVNELAKIFNLLNIDTQDVLEAAGTKWNFLPFKPGLVGGHCIGVDPYYLTKKAMELGYDPKIILSGRRINDSMGIYVADQVIKLMLSKGIKVNNARVLVLGITFKENCPDVRNTKVVDIIHRLNDQVAAVDIHDPWANENEVKLEYQLISKKNLPEGKYEAIILAVSHKEFLKLDYAKFKTSNGIIYDVKGILGNISDAKL